MFKVKSFPHLDLIQRMNTANLRFQSKCGKIQSRKTVSMNIEYLCNVIGSTSNFSDFILTSINSFSHSLCLNIWKYCNFN